MASIALKLEQPTRPRVLSLFVALLAGAALIVQAQTAQGQSRPDSLADLAERISPAVVNITTTTTIAQTEERPVIPEGSPLEDFFKDFMDRQQRPNQGPRSGSALGSGFVISEDGFIVTNNHVIDKADEVIIEFFNGGELEAEIVGVDPKTDIALLKVESDEPLPFVEFGDSDVARVGDWVMAIGNPLGQGFSVSAGIVSARNRALRGSYDDFIQTDAAINRGNSGGPLFNMDGDVIGVNTAILSPNGGSIGIGFSMSSAVVKNVVAQLQEYGETKRGWLGVRIQDVEEDVAEALKLSDARGALVTDVPDGPAKDGGILARDVIMSFDGKKVEDIRSLVRIVGDTQVGKNVEVEVYRDGKMETLMVNVGRLEEASVSLASATEEDIPEPAGPASVIGLEIAGISDEMRAQFSLDADAEGVIVIGVDEESEAFEKGLRDGDVIAEVAQEAVSDPQDVVSRLKAAKDAGRTSILLLVRRGGQPRFVAINPAG